MKRQTQFKNASLVSVVNGNIVVKDATGKEHRFINASIVSVNNSTIIIETEWEPKEGELVKASGCGINCYTIFKSLNGRFLYSYGAKSFISSFYCIDLFRWWTADTLILSPVTPEEQKEFDDFCKSKGKVWNKETLQWEKYRYRWKPERGEEYYVVNLEHEHSVGSHTWLNDSVDCANYNAYNCFQTREQAEKASKEVINLLKSL